MRCREAHLAVVRGRDGRNAVHAQLDIAPVRCSHPDQPYLARHKVGAGPSGAVAALAPDPGVHSVALRSVGAHSGSPVPPRGPRAEPQRRDWSVRRRREGPRWRRSMVRSFLDAAVRRGRVAQLAARPRAAPRRGDPPCPEYHSRHSGHRRRDGAGIVASDQPAAAVVRGGPLPLGAAHFRPIPSLGARERSAARSVSGRRGAHSRCMS